MLMNKSVCRRSLGDWCKNPSARFAVGRSHLRRCLSSPIPQHRLRRGALHLAPPRSQIVRTQFHTSLLRCCGILGLVCSLACGGGDGKPREDRGGSAGGQRRGRAAGGAPWGGGESTAAVPVEVAVAELHEISSYIETNGTLEAENEVDLVARIAAPVVRLNVEEGDRINKGDLLAQLDDEEIRARAEISKANLHESRLAFERAERLHEANLISPEDYEQVLTRFDTSRAQFESDQIELGYTDIRAPFSGLIISRYVNFAEQVSPNSPLFRISDFDPLLCPIRIPERDLPRVRLDQQAYLTLEAWPNERFAAKVLRISPIVEAATGTVKVTLAIESQGRLRPGMFASVFLKTETRADTLVVPKSALSLDSIGDTVYVVKDRTAQRREVELGFQEGDFVEVVSGIAPGELIVVVGQDGLSDGTPIRIISDAPSGRDIPSTERGAAGQANPEVPEGPGGFSGRRGGGSPRDFSEMSPEQLQRMREMMKIRGLTDAQIDERIRNSQQPGKDGGE